MKKGARQAPPLFSLEPVPAAAFGALDQESDQPNDDGGDQDVPQHVPHEPATAEDQQDQEQRDKGWTHVSFLLLRFARSSTRQPRSIKPDSPYVKNGGQTRKVKSGEPGGTR